MARPIHRPIRTMILCASGVTLAVTIAALGAAPTASNVASPTASRVRTAIATPSLGADPAPVAPTAAVLRGSDEVGAPPGLVLIPAGRYEVGADEEFITELVRRNEAYGATLGSELGGRPMTLPDFYLMPTEVTNEQYAAFVRATGYRPPQDWADPEALRAAQEAFNTEQGEKIRAAREAGQPAPEREQFDITRWFDRRWEAGELEWAVPKGRETHPATWIDHEGARAYAEWAGLRLMTEFEFQAAARGRGNQNPFPWGEEWDPSRTACLTSARSKIQPAGSMGFVTETGLHDLVGNVWEWTDSPFVAYERFEAPFEVEFGSGRGKRTEQFFPAFDPDNRVAVGGSVDFDEIATRISTRRSTDRYQRTEKLGFRCAATVGNAFDKLTAIMRTLRGDLRLRTPMAPERALAFHRWLSSPGTAEVEGYAVIEGYDHLAIAPVAELDVANISDLTIQSLEEGPVAFALLTTSVPIAQPPLEPGTYKLSWRGKGEPRPKGDDEDEEQEIDPASFPYDINEINLLITDAQGQVRAIYDGSDVDVVKADDDHPLGKLELLPWEEPKRKPAEGEEVVPVDSIDVTVDVVSGRKGRVVRFVFGLQVAAGTIDGGWLGVGGKGTAR